MKTVITVTFILSCLSVYAQGISSGLSYRHDFQQTIENERYQAELDRISVQDNIRQLRSLHESRTSFRHIPNGWHKSFVTDNSNYLVIRQVYVESEIVKWLLSSEGVKYAIEVGGKIVNEKTTIQVGLRNEIVDVYVGYAKGN